MFLKLELENLAHKSLSMVGNASSLLQKTAGSTIDEQDCVIRMNNGVIVNSAAQGVRTDIHVFSTQFALRSPIPFPTAQQRLWMSPKFRDLCTLENTQFYPIKNWEKLHTTLGARPSVGVMALDLISTCSIDDVHIFGFDFKETPTFYNKNKSHGPHNFAAERKFVLNLVKDNNWTFHK